MPSEPLNTINGGSAIHCDPIPSLLAERLEHLSLYGPLFEALENGHFSSAAFGGGEPECQLEVEVRLGFIQNVRSEQRFSLPLTTDTLVSNRAPVKFVPGVSEDQYNAARNFLVETAENEGAGGAWSTALNACSVNRFFELPGYEELVRISVPAEGAGGRQGREGGFESIRKVNLLKWNVRSGSSEQAGEEPEESPLQDSLDYRIAVNLEYRVPLANLPTTSNAKHCRRRQRDSFVNAAGRLRFDLSKVEDATEGRGAPAPPTFEIELELLGEEVVRTLQDRSLTPDERLLSLKYACATLVRSTRFVRDLLSSRSERLKYSSFLSSISDRVGLYDLRIASPDEEAVSRYRSVLSPQLPLIGDYLYRVVARELERRPGLHEGRRSLYTEHAEDIPGPFGVTLDEQGRKSVTLIK